MGQFLSSAGSSEEEEMHLSHAVLLLCPEHQCLCAGRSCSPQGEGWQPWAALGALVLQDYLQPGWQVNGIAVTCNPDKNRRHNSLLCLGSAGMQQASRARDGRVLNLSCPILEYIKTAGRKHCREKRGWKKPNRESNTVAFHSVVTSFSLITTDTPLFSLIYLLFHSRSQKINN